MISKICIVIALITLLVYMYGILVTITAPEKNTCQMTYMFEYPQFVKIHFRQNEKFPKYNLYAYSEGRLTEAARNMKFNGAPVIFVHGNGGSYKQARSFASVALRKGIDNKWIQHLDYFTVDFNEEYSALFGGTLYDQSLYLELCINTVLNLYKDLPNRPTSVSIVAHSMGGKIAQSILMNRETAKQVNTIIALATPLDQPVLNIDFYSEAFYRKSNEYWLQHRPPADNVITNLTNTCCNASNYALISNQHHESVTVVDANNKNINLTSYILKDILLITIGGGSRDRLVHSGLTTSRFSDVHTMSTCMPNVWLTTDHLSSVWCLQQVIVINRFLYSIVQTTHSKQKIQTNSFIEDKAIRLSKAKYYFTENIVEPKNRHDVMVVNNANDIGDWVEDIRRVFTEKFKNGLNRTRVQMIRLNKLPNHQILNVEAINIDTDDWVFGCSASKIDQNQRYCARGQSLTHYVRKLPSRRYNRKLLTLDLHKIKDDFPDYTHIILKVNPTKVPVQLNIDIHAAEDRQLIYRMPSWYSYSKHIVAEDTILGANKYRLNIMDLHESYQALELNINARCSKETYHVVTKICVPWTRGFERYHYFTEEEKTPLYISTPLSKPSGYNTTINPITVDFTLDPNCRYTISLQNSFSQTAARIFQQFSHWIPAHLVAILFLAFRHQIGVTPPTERFKCSSLNSAYSAGSTFFIITASRLFVKVILWTKSFPDPDQFKHSILISFIIHGSALAILHLVTYALWIATALCGNIAYQFLFKLTQWPVSAGIILPAIQKFPITIGIVLISMALASCGGLPLLCAVLVYFVLISKMYEDYLEEFVFKTAKLIAEKLFGKKSKETNQSTAAVTASIAAQLENKETTEDTQKLMQTEENTQNDENSPNTENSVSKQVVPANNTIASPVANGTEGENSFEVLYNQLDPSDLIDANEEENTLAIADENDEEAKKQLEAHEAVDAELEKLISEMLASQKEDDDKRNKKLKAERVEYDAVHDGLSAINFHITLFLLLCILAILNIPSVIVWSQNYGFGEKILQNDPSYFPAIATIISLSVIWQFPTPRNVYGYESLATLCYLMAIISVLYCQDSLYRLNAIISSMFIVIALQQVFMPKLKAKNEVPVETNIDIDLLERVRRLREDMVVSELKPSTETNEQINSIPDEGDAAKAK